MRVTLLLFVLAIMWYMVHSPLLTPLSWKVSMEDHTTKLSCMRHLRKQEIIDLVEALRILFQPS